MTEVSKSDQSDRLIKALESIADSLGYLAVISESLEGIASNTYEINEKLETLIGETNGGLSYLRTADMFAAD